MSAPAPPRLAVCVSGQLRGAEEALPALARATAGLDADIIFSVWDAPGRKLDGSIHFHQLDRLFAGDVRLAISSRWLGPVRLWAALPLAHARLAALSGAAAPGDTARLIQGWFPQAVVDVQPADLLDLAFEEPRDDANAKKMLYLLWRAEEIRRRRQRTRGAYDLVFRTRPDIAYEALDPQAWMATPERAVLVDGYVPHLRHMGDFYAIARPAAMDVYAATFARAIATPFTWRNVHQELGRQITDAGLEVLPYPLPSRLVREPTLSTEDMLEVLADQRRQGPFGPMHAAAEVALQALRALELGSPALAEQRLAALDVAAAPPEALESWLNLAAVTAGRQGGRREALAAAALADLVSEHRGTLREDHPLLHLVVADVDAWLLPGPAGASLTEALETVAARLDTTLDAEAQRALAAARHESFHPHGRVALAVASMSDAPADRRRLPVGALWAAADALKHAGRLGEAEDWQRAALEQAQDHAGANRQLAEILLMQGQPAEARPYAARAWALEPQPAHAALLSLAEAQLGAETPPDVLAAAAAYPVDGELARVPGLSDHLRRLQAAAAV